MADKNNLMRKSVLKKDAEKYSYTPRTEGQMFTKRVPATVKRVPMAKFKGDATGKSIARRDRPYAEMDPRGWAKYEGDDDRFRGMVINPKSGKPELRPGLR